MILAGMGGPEVIVVVLLAVGLAVWGMSRVMKKNQFSRFCPKCGRGLNLPSDAQCCSHCGARLP